MDVAKRAVDDLRGRRCFCSWSGGKDSCLALHRAAAAGAEIELLVTMLIEGGSRSRSHGLRDAVIAAQARSIGANLSSVATSWQNYEESFVAVLKRAQAEGIDVGVFGDIDILRHREWEEKVCAAAGMQAVLPLWQEDRHKLLREFLDAGYQALIVAVRQESLPAELLGRRLTPELVADLTEHGVDACGENGEFHTLVTDGPIFAKPLSVQLGNKTLRDGYWFQDLSIT